MNDKNERQLEATIHLAEKRGRSADHNLQTAHTFNDRQAINENPKPFEKHLQLNDHNLAAASTASFELQRGQTILMLPVVGGLEFQLPGFEKTFLDVGNAVWFTVQSESTLVIRNLYHKESINFLWISFSCDTDNKNDVVTCAFDLDAHRNALVPLQSGTSLCGIGSFIGAFEGRKHEGLTIDLAKSVFVFVVQGAFEVEDRLLQPRDGLAFRNLTSLAFESLSENAVILVFTF
jgi:quercetin 2,3-dioxygenase